MSNPGAKYFESEPEDSLKDGIAGSVNIIIEDCRIPLRLRLDLANHSPTGFGWNYHGSGPSQLALAILAYTGSDDWALEHYQEFKREVVALLKPGSWRLEYDFVRRWILGVQQREGYRPRKNHGDQQ